MKIETLKNERVSDFIEYCKKYRKQLDDSFLYDNDLRNFEVNNDNPTYIAIDDQDELIGVVSLMKDDYYRSGRRGRFRILYSHINDNRCYEMLMDEILRDVNDLDNLDLFIPMINKKLIENAEKLKFNVYRYAFILIRNIKDLKMINLPEDYYIRAFRAGADEQYWCDIRNAAFANLKGGEIPINKQMVEEMLEENEHIDGGMMLLCHHDKPIGIIRGTDDEYEDMPIMNIGPVGMLPEYQGKGLGKCLIRRILEFAREKGYMKAILCVNGENERAKALYVGEGFKQAEGAVCYRYRIAGKQ